jgi:murein DD-endopeptidase MepM/ murein hydrolase activator NlpD
MAGLAGFGLGAATVLLILWLYGGGRLPQAEIPVAATPPTALPAPPATVPEAQTTPAPAPPPAVTPPRLAPTVSPPPADLAWRDLLVPVQGIRREDLLDTFDDPRNGLRLHEAIDIMAPRNTPVLAVEAGRIVKLFSSVRGGLTIYQFDPTEAYCYYYAHLESYAPGLEEGNQVARGQVIGAVGTSGNAGPNNPHLHFAIFRLDARKHWWQGVPINPFPLLAGDADGDRPAR